MNVKTLLDRLTSAHEEIGQLRLQAAGLQRQLLNAETPPAIGPLEIEELLAAMNRGLKIEAIKAVRTMTGLPLKEAKELVERHFVSQPPRDAAA